MNILICDDDVMTIRMVEFQLKKDGHEITTAKDGALAKQIIAENPEIACIIVDIHMPHYSGLELITFVREELKSNVPIIVLTRVNVEETRRQAMNLGASAYITKPFELKAISEQIKQII